MSLLYGSSALGGVVNVIREEIPGALPEHTRAALSVQGATVAPGGTVGGWVVTPFRGLALRAEGSGRSQGDLHTPDGTVTNTDAQTMGAAAGAGAAGDWGHGGIAYRFYQNDYGIPGGFVGGHQQGVDISMRRHTARGEFEHHFEHRTLSRVRVTGQYSDYYHTEMSPSGSIGTLFGQDLASLETVALHNHWGPFTQGAAGIRGQYRDVRTGGSLRTPSTYDFSGAVFAVEEIGQGRLRGQIGLRYEAARYVPRDTSAFIVIGGERVPVQPRNFGDFAASAGVLFAIRRDLSVGISIARAFRTPDFNELYSNGPHLAANSYDVGNPALQSESGLGADLFVRVTAGRVEAQAAAFVNDLTNYIFPSSRGQSELGPQGQPRFQYSNENARFVGAEGSVAIALTPALLLDGTISHVLAEFTSSRDSIPIITPSDTSFIAASPYPPLIPPLRGRIGLRYERQAWFAGLAMQLVAAQDRVGDFETPTAGYALAELAVGLRLLAGNRLHAITLRVDNLGDRRYRDHMSRIKDIMPGPGRNVSLLYRLSL
jgi:iron complex outermembrane receptor protein